MSRPGAATDTLPQLEKMARLSSKSVVATTSTLSDAVMLDLLTSVPFIAGRDHDDRALAIGVIDGVLLDGLSSLPLSDRLITRAPLSAA